MPLISSLELIDRNADLETHIDDLVKQKQLIESIEQHSYDIDFGDLLETYNLLVHEIERLRYELKDLSDTDYPGEEVYEEEEEESFSSLYDKYNIEHVIRDSYGMLRKAKPDDFDMGYHKGVRDAFTVVYEMQKRYNSSKEYEEDEEELAECSFEMQNNMVFAQLMRRKMGVV